MCNTGGYIMNMTSSSLSYLFLILSALCLVFLFYFKILVINTSEHSKNKSKIIGSMKDPDAWRSRNNKMSYVFLFWTIVSFLIFVYLKYFFGLGLISTIYVIAYFIVMIISIGFFGMRRKSTN
jgi:TRAP-type uncharacterized transport system fused permease subunit